MAKLMGVSRSKVEEMLKNSDVIELNLNERASKRASRRSEENDDLKIYENL